MIPSPLPPRKLVIVGGGSAGWMAAAYLRKVLPETTALTLVESPRVGAIGVGEGTIPIIRELVELLGLQERDWMTACQATFKLGIRFNDWAEPGRWWWHPFYFKHPRYPEKQIVDSWIDHRLRGQSAFQDPASLQHGCMSWQLAKGNRVPRFLASCGDFEQWDSDHAFHFDAHLFGQCLREHAVAAGVVHIVDHVEDAILSREGAVDSIVTENHGKIAGDFFLDCTGFRRLLTSAVSSARYISFNQQLLCDAAVTLAVPYQDPGVEMRPFTVATALSSGWTWQISLFHRVGFGYVYSSQHLDKNAAELELRAFVGRERTAELEARHLKFSAGRLETPWVKNCVAIGLSEGFVEPLEATSLGVTQHHLRELAKILNSSVDKQDVAGYNAAVADIYDEVKQFLVSHYCLTKRRDTPFWQDVSQLESPVIPREASPSPGRSMGIRHAVFAPQSWTCLAAGFDRAAARPRGQRAARVLSMDELIQAQQSQQRVLPGFVRQFEFLKSIRLPHA